MDFGHALGQAVIRTVRPRRCRGRILTSLLFGVLATSVAAQQPAAAADVKSAPAARPTQNATSAESQRSAGDVDVCSLLTTADIAAVQGERLRETRPSEQISGSLRLLQCYYATPTMVKSVSLAVAVPNSGSNPRQYWQARFNRSSPAAAEKWDEKAAAKPGHSPPIKIAGIGEEAFWMGSRFAGALYVLSGDKFLRVSVGGGSEEEKLEKSKQLAHQALRRLGVIAAEVLP